jgi:hypothetical protein
MASRIKRPQYKDKMVIRLSTNDYYRDRIKDIESYDYISTIIEKILIKNNVMTNRVFIGGDKEDLLAFLSNIIYNFQLSDIYIDDDSEYYVDDSDFD